MANYVSRYWNPFNTCNAVTINGNHSTSFEKAGEYWVQETIVLMVSTTFIGHLFSKSANLDHSYSGIGTDILENKE